jgi:uncharacterized paraquat-inducible protein A
VNKHALYWQINSVHTMWASRSHALALLIAVMSGVWPYVKLVAMLGLWFGPCEPMVRGRVLWWLEFLGKWSLIDMFVFTMMVVGFAVDIDAVANVQACMATQPWVPGACYCCSGQY